MSGTEEEDLMADAWAAALEEQVTAEAKPAPLEELKDDAPISAEERRKLDTILDIPVTIAMEVGRSQISIRNLLQLNQELPNRFYCNDIQGVSTQQPAG